MDAKPYVGPFTLQRFTCEGRCIHIVMTSISGNKVGEWYAPGAKGELRPRLIATIEAMCAALNREVEEA